MEFKYLKNGEKFEFMGSTFIKIPPIKNCSVKDNAVCIGGKYTDSIGDIIFIRDKALVKKVK